MCLAASTSCFTLASALAMPPFEEDMSLPWYCSPKMPGGGGGGVKDMEGEAAAALCVSVSKPDEIQRRCGRLRQQKQPMFHP